MFITWGKPLRLSSKLLATAETPFPNMDWFNSLAPGKFEWNFRYLIFQIISVMDGWGISCELALKWMSLDLTNDKSTLVQVMAWCRQATSHYLSQCWPRSLLPYELIPAWISNYIQFKVWDEITYPFPNFSGAAIEVWEWILDMWLLIHAGIKVNPCL